MDDAYITLHKEEMQVILCSMWQEVEALMRLPKRVLKGILEGENGQHAVDALVTYSRIRDVLGYESDDDTTAEELVIQRISQVAPGLKPSYLKYEGTGKRGFKETLRVNEDNIEDPLDPNQLEWMQKRFGFRF